MWRHGSQSSNGNDNYFISLYNSLQVMKKKILQRFILYIHIPLHTGYMWYYSYEWEAWFDSNQEKVVMFNLLLGSIATLHYTMTQTRSILTHCWHFRCIQQNVLLKSKYNNILTCSILYGTFGSYRCNCFGNHIEEVVGNCQSTRVPK
jgi:hypothetical protein